MEKSWAARSASPSGAGGGIQIEPAVVQPDQFVLQFAPARSFLPAPYAADEIETTVEIDHPLAAGGLMKPVDVSGSEPPSDRPIASSRANARWASLGRGPTEVSPSD